MPLTDSDNLVMDSIINRYPRSRSAIMPLLHFAQSKDGYVTPESIEVIAKKLNLESAEVSAVATFYTQYKRGPVGEYHVGVCTNTLCAIMGGDEIFESLKEHLGVENNGVTQDGKVSIEHIECNAACDYAPVVMANWEFYDNQSVDSAKDLVDSMRQGSPIAPTRGPDKLPTWKENSALLAGINDGLANQGVAAGEPTLLGLKIAQSGNKKLTPELTKSYDQKDSFTLDGYRRNGGYKAIEKALNMSPDEVIQAVKDSGLRGRGGAGFPTGMKWGFIPQGDNKEHYFVVNADESEPGTCKDTPLMLANPHVLIEGIIIGSYAIRAKHAFIYVRGEVAHVIRRVQQAIEDAYKAGLLGKNILGKGFDLDLVLHVGAGAYICGEETALLDSLEGFRGQPRLRPPFPAIAGLYARPTVVNNVESVASVPAIINNGAQWFASLGTEKSKGFTLYSLSGHVKNPGQFEAPLGITLRELIDMAGGMRNGNKLKFWTPGGSSTPIFTDEHLDIPLDYEGVAAAGSMLGTKALQIFDETTSVVRAVLRWTEFYKHESCGKCTPCREGTWWLVQILKDLDAGKGEQADLEKLLDLCDNIAGRSFCALADGAASPIISSIKYFREEYLEHLRIGGSPFNPAASSLLTPDGVKV